MWYYILTPIALIIVALVVSRWLKRSVNRTTKPIFLPEKDIKQLDTKKLNKVLDKKFDTPKEKIKKRFTGYTRSLLFKRAHRLPLTLYK